jgi:hypothetical protein
MEIKLPRCDSRSVISFGVYFCETEEAFIYLPEIMETMAVPLGMHAHIIY